VPKFVTCRALRVTCRALRVTAAKRHLPGAARHRGDKNRHRCRKTSPANFTQPSGIRRQAAFDRKPSGIRRQAAFDRKPSGTRKQAAFEGKRHSSGIRAKRRDRSSQRNPVGWGKGRAQPAGSLGPGLRRARRRREASLPALGRSGASASQPSAGPCPAPCGACGRTPCRPSLWILAACFPYRHLAQELEPFLRLRVRGCRWARPGGGCG